MNAKARGTRDEHRTRRSWFIGIPLLGAGGKIEGRSQGFLEGCQAGFAEGVNRVLEISPEENAEPHRRAIEIKTDQMIVDGFNRSSRTDGN